MQSNRFGFARRDKALPEVTSVNTTSAEQSRASSPVVIKNIPVLKKG